MPATPRLNCSFTEPRCTCRGLGLLPRPTKPRPAGVWSLFDLPEAGKPAAGWGRGGEGVSGHVLSFCVPPPYPSPVNGGGERTDRAAPARRRVGKGASSRRAHAWL